MLLVVLILMVGNVLVQRRLARRDFDAGAPAGRGVAGRACARRDGGGLMATAVPPADGTGGPAGLGSLEGDKGLKTGAIGFVSSVVIGVASTAPGYSLAASLGLVVAVSGIGLQAPAIMLVAFVPMLFIASAYYYLNRADPDCGTTFAWVTRAMGPWAGWIGGWAIIIADIIVMANLAQIAGLYSFLLVRLAERRGQHVAVTLVGVVMDRDHDLDLRHRDRAVRAHPGRPARRRDHRRWPCSRSSRSSRSPPAPPGRTPSTRASRG